ncbi:MAG: NAD(P)/FAD-dependent oxidoreductase [Vicinamibacterales bacterium]
MSRPRVVIVGGGFGGLFAAKQLVSAPVDVTLVDRENHHLFQPLLYQVATAGLSPADIASPIRWILRRAPNVRVLFADATSIDVARRRVLLDEGALDYDYLILATGATHAYFGHDDWKPFAPGLKTLEDALTVRRRILLAFEQAERATSAAVRRRLLTFVVIGGGPTGVELAGALAEISRHTLANDFRSIDPRLASLILLEGGPSILSTFPESLRRKAAASLLDLGVMVRTNARVTQIEPGVVHVGGERIEADVVLWAAGVAASPLGASLGVPLDRVGRVIVGPDLTIPGHPEVFVIGDLAAATQDGRPLPGVAQVAMQAGRYAARAIRRAIAGRPGTAFRYFDPGNMATIGRAAAVADFGWLRLSGWLAWLTWLFVHVLNLQGFRNRLLVLVQWVWAYLTYQRSGRLIVGDPRRRS